MNLEKKRQQLRQYEKSEKRKTRNNELRRLKRNTEQGKEKQREYKQSASGRFRDIKHNSKRRKIDFQIKFEEFKNLFYEKPCSYCGDVARGIDRMNSSGSYVAENCTPCCRICNSMKSTLSVKEFEEKILQIFIYRDLSVNRKNEENK